MEKDPRDPYIQMPALPRVIYNLGQMSSGYWGKYTAHTYCIHGSLGMRYEVQIAWHGDLLCGGRWGDPQLIPQEPHPRTPPSSELLQWAQTEASEVLKAKLEFVFFAAVFKGKEGARYPVRPARTPSFPGYSPLHPQGGTCSPRPRGRGSLVCGVSGL